MDIFIELTATIMQNFLIIWFISGYCGYKYNGIKRYISFEIILLADCVSILQVLCKYKIVQKNLFKWTELNSVRFYVIRKISTCQ